MAAFRSRTALQLEILALRHQLGALQRSVKRPKLTAADRFLWAWLSRLWADWRAALVIVKPETVIAWHRKGFRLFWAWKTWRTFLDNQLKSLVSVDFFTVPTIRFQVLYVFLVLAHQRRRILHFGVTAHPTAQWTTQQLREAFPWDTAPRYLLRDRDRIFGDDFTQQVQEFGIKEVLAAARSPWQRAYSERVIGSIRRECLDHVIIVSEASLRRILGGYLDYDHGSRTHLSLEMDSPEPRSVQTPEMGPVVAVPQVGGLHHRYERRAA